MVVCQRQFHRFEDISRAGCEYRRIADKERAIRSDGGGKFFQAVFQDMKSAIVVQQLQHKGSIGRASAKSGSEGNGFQQMDFQFRDFVP